MAGVMTAQIALLSVASFLPPTMTRTVVSTLGSCSLALPIIGYFIVLSCSEALDDWPSIGRIVLFGLCSVVFSLITFSCFAFFFSASSKIALRCGLSLNEKLALRNDGNFPVQPLLFNGYTADMDSPDDLSIAVSKAWEIAARTFDINVTAPYVLRLGAKMAKFEAFLPDFGSPNGMVLANLTPEWESNPEKRKCAVDAGLFISFINPEFYAVFDKKEFWDALKDWGYFGAKGVNRNGCLDSVVNPGRSRRNIRAVDALRMPSIRSGCR